MLPAAVGSRVSTSQQLTLAHLDHVCLQHLAAALDVDPHQHASSLLACIGGKLTKKLQYTWEASILPGQPLAVYGFSLVTHQDSLYLYGGRCGSLDMADQGNQDIWRYDPVSHDWAPIEVQGDVPAARRWHTAVVHNDDMLVFGGQQWGGTEWEAISTLMSFSFITRRWSQVAQHGYVPTPRYRHSCATLGHHMYMLPGEGQEGPCTSIYCFDMTTKTWTLKTCSGPGPSIRCVESLAAWQGELYCIAINDHPDCMRLYKLDVRPGHGNQWSLVSVTDDSCVPKSRKQCCAFLYDSTWIISGGVSSGEERTVISDLWIFELSSSRWSPVQLPDSFQHSARASHAAAALDGSVVIIGGWHSNWPQPCPGIHVNKIFLHPDRTCNSTSSAIPNTDLCKQLAAAKKHMPFSDVKLVSCDGKEFAAHRVILSSQSEVFARMLSSDMIEATTGSVNLPDIRADVLHAMLEFMYGGLQDIPPDLVIDLFSACDRFGLDGLRAQCALRMQQCLREDTAALVAAIAKLHNLPELWAACVEFASAQGMQSKVFASKAYSELWSSSPLVAQQFTTEVAASAARYTEILTAMVGDDKARIVMAKRAREH